MKIFRNEAVYVQKNDVAYFNKFDEPILASVYVKLFSEPVNIINDRNRYEFIKYEEAEEIEFFKKQEWILDYDTVKSLSEEELIKLGCSFSDKLNELASVINNPSTLKDTAKELYEQYQKLQYKMYSLRDYIWFKKGMLDMKIPEEIESEKPKVQETEKPKLFQKIFNRLKKGENKND